MSAIYCLARSARHVVTTPFRVLRDLVYRRDGLLPFYHYRATGGPAPTGDEVRRLLAMDAFPVPNLSRGYQAILQDWWEEDGLGARCLLVSETEPVKRVFAQRYPGSSFVCTDFFTDLRGGEACDVVWDICKPPPAALSPASFDSVICKATLEHVLDPVGAMRHLASLTAPGGTLYVHTCTPGFPYHPCPGDYLRFWPGWFEDLPALIGELALRDLLCARGLAFARYRVGQALRG